MPSPGVRAAALAASVIFFAETAAFLVLRSMQPTTPPRRADAARLMNELMSGKPVGAPFTLTDAEGRSRSLAEFRGKLVVLYFGFTYCPDVCPADLLAIGAALKELGADAANVQPLFVTLDPVRDTPEMLRSYVASFHPSFVALTGSESEIRDVARSFKVFYEKVPYPGPAKYAIDHMALTFVLDRNGRYLGALPGGTSPDRIAVFVREMLARSD